MRSPSALLLALAGLGSTASAFEIALEKSLIPELKKPFPYLNLQPAVQPDSNIMKRTLLERAPESNNMTDFAAGTVDVHFDGNDLVAFKNPTTSKITVLPPISNLQPVKDISTGGAEKFLSDSKLFPKDGTSVKIVIGSKLQSVTHSEGANNVVNSDEGIVLATAKGQRTVKVDSTGETLDVHGTGSKATFGFGAGDKLKSLTYLWHPAKKADSTVQPGSVDDTRKAILAQLEPSAKIGPVKVDSIEPCFYDGGGRFIQPTYFFTATILPPPGAKTSGNAPHARISGYVPIGKTALEPLPSLVAPGDLTLPTEPQPPSRITRREEMPPVEERPPPPELDARAALPTVTVGRYVVRNDSSAWVASANDFWKKLTTTTPNKAHYVNSQYYWAHPEYFTTRKEAFVDSVNVALTEVHGNWDYFTTYQNWGEGVSLGDIPAPGYGSGGNPKGQLAYWILHSCEVIPTSTDYPGHGSDSFKPWWKIMQGGLHAALGFRTEMWIADGVTGPFATLAARGGAVVASWLQAVHDDSDYAPRPSNWYFDANRGIQEPMGRASAVFVCGHADDKIWDTQKLGKPTCLQEMWWNN